jgi:diguanylate cyclase (GGDEF)-like protein/PAS domain S-box-containing protein
MKVKINLEFLEEALNEHAIVSMADAAGDITYANQKFLDISGYTLPELMGKNHRILKSGIHSSLFYQNMWDTLLSGKTWFGDLSNQHKNGDIYWMRVSIKPVLNQEGLPIQYLSIRTDITDQKSLATKLSKQKEEIESLYHTTRDGIAMLDMEARFLAVNPAYERMTGFTQAELLQTTCIALSAPEEMLRSTSVLKQVLATGYINNHEKTCITKSGQRINVSASIALMPNQQRILINTREITENRKREHALSLAKERAEVTLASIGDAVITTDTAGLITFLNQDAVNLTGWALNDAMGKPLSEIFNIIHENTRQKVNSPVEAVLRDGKTVMLSSQTVLVSKNGTEYNIEDSAAPIFLPDGTMIGCVLVFYDVTEKYRLQNTMRWQAAHDPLTNLPNRILLTDHFNHSIARAQRQQKLLAVCMIDLDEFKPVNDQYGHDVGDLLLIEAAKRLNAVIRNDDTAARLGGDEFVLLLSDITDVDELQIIMERLLAALSSPYLIDKNHITLSASIGSVLYPLDDADADTLLRHADQAMYQAKQRGRNQHQMFDVSLDTQIIARHKIIREVKKALRDNELVLYYQPKVNMRTGVVMGMEALLRWQHPTQGLIPPLDFLPQIEKTDLIIDIGVWVMNQAMRQIAAWHEAGKSWVVSVNIAALHFHNGDFAQHLKDTLTCYPNVPSSLLEIEILESVALGDINQVNQLIRDCHAMGVSFSLDDFGTGYSSLSYLKRLPAETIKIDQSFVHDILDNKDDLALVESIIDIGRAFGRKIIAEGVETAEQGVALLNLGCDLAQGYGIAKPMPAMQVLNWSVTYVADDAWAA